MTALSKEEYLKRYLQPAESGDYKKKRKKKKDKVKIGRGMKIVDDDISWNTIAPKEEEEDFPDALLTKEEKPQIEVIDNRTKEEKALDEYRKSKKWKKLAGDEEKSNGFTKDDVIEVRDSGSDLDIPRAKNSSSSPEKTKRRVRHDSDSDVDVSRTKRGSRQAKRHDSDSDADVRPAHRRHDSDSDMDIPREKKNYRKIKRHDSDSDTPRSKKEKGAKESRKHKRHDSDSDIEIPRVKRGKSPPRGRGKHRDPGSDIDVRKKERTKYKNEKLKVRPRHDSSPDSDLNIPRSKGQKSNRGQSSASGSDLELPRARTSRHDSDSDLEIPRKGLNKNNSDLDGKRESKGRKRHDSSSSGEDKKKAAKKKALMSSGGVGGLTSRSELKRELEERKHRELDIDKLAKDSRKNETVYREKGGKKRDFTRERAELEAEEAEKRKKKEKYDKWGGGVAQNEMKSKAMVDLIHESSKPLARYADDDDLDAFQRSQIRDGDPMAEYIAKKKNKEKGNAPSLPKYRGPAPAPNRFHIQPGYRWDGVDRSNGFEKKYYESISNRAANRQDAYKWSVEDM